MISSSRASVIRAISSSLGKRSISTSKIISTAANADAKASDVSHFATFKEYRVFAQQFGPLASTAWAQKITKPVATPLSTSTIEEAVNAFDKVLEEKELNAIRLGGASD